MFGDVFLREHDFFKNPAQSLSDSYVNGMDALVMQSGSDADKMIAGFRLAISEGYSPEEVEQDLYQQLGVNPADLLWYDRDRITKAVEEMLC